MKPDQLELRKAIFKAVRNRDRWALKAKNLHDLGKLDEARKALERAEHWELQRRKLDT